MSSGFDRQKAKGILLMTGAALSFAVMSALFKVASAEVSVFEIVFFRGIVGGLLLIAGERLAGLPYQRAVNAKGVFFRAAFGFAGILLYVYAINHVDLGLASALNQSSPIFVVFLSFFMLGERPPVALPVLAVVALVGVWLIIAPDLTSIDIHASAGAVSAVMAALAYIWVRKLSKTETPRVIVRYFTLWTALLAVPLLIYDGWIWPSPTMWVVLISSGVFGLLGQLLMTWSYSIAEASAVSPFLYVSVLGSFIAGWLFWGEWPAFRALIGCLILVVATLSIVVVNGRRHAPPGDG